MEAEHQHEDGKKNGISKYYNKKGEIQTETPYVNDKEDGIAILYDPNGKINVKMTYKGGRKSWIKVYDRKGNLLYEGDPNVLEKKSIQEIEDLSVKR